MGEAKGEWIFYYLKRKEDSYEESIAIFDKGEEGVWIPERNRER